MKAGFAFVVVVFIVILAFQNCSQLLNESRSDNLVAVPTAQLLLLEDQEGTGSAALTGAGNSLLTGAFVRQQNQVLRVGEASAWDSHGVYNPVIVLTTSGETYRDLDGFYYMYYTGNDGSGGTDYDATGLAVSLDLVNWEKLSINGPVLPRGEPGTIDAGDASAVTVLHDGVMFHMWHEANATPPGDNSGDYVRIAYATSIDGRTWIKRGWVIQPEVSYDAQDVYAPVVVKHNNLWKMWYTGHDESGRFGVMHATAPAPEGPWQRISNAFVFHPADDTFVSQVWREGDELFLLYQATVGAEGSAMWIAKFIDGVWVPQRRLLDRRTEGWDANEPGSWPSIAVSDKTLYVFYSANVYYGGGIGFFTVPLE